MIIVSREELRNAYKTMSAIEANDKIPLDKKDIAIRLLKKAIRDFYRQENAHIGEKIIISDRGMDGYTELFRLWEEIRTREDAIEYLESGCLDCDLDYDPGKGFTCWYKIIQRNGRFWAYHGVRFDA